jgi:hypothetical protein
MNQLSPALNKENWTQQEDLQIVHHQRLFGNAWSQIAQYLPGRSANAVKNRWSWLARHNLPGPFAHFAAPVVTAPRALPIPQIAPRVEPEKEFPPFPGFGEIGFPYLDGENGADAELRLSRIGGEFLDEDLFHRFHEWNS